MNKEIKQILRNQRLIMMKLNLESEGDFADTELLLNPNKNKEDCCDMSEKEFALEEKSAEDQE